MSPDPTSQDTPIPSTVRERLRALVDAERADAVLFVGDATPESPRQLAARIARLAASGALEPDDYSRGGAVAVLERRWADLLGKEAAVWLPTGTLANHLAVRRLARGRPRVLVQEQSHLWHDEGDLLQRLSGLAVVPLAPGRSMFTLDELHAALEDATGGRVDSPVGAVVIETPVRRQAGQIAPFEVLEAITARCRERGVGTHLDGARLFMMSGATGIAPRRYAALFDTVYVSLWKYLPAPFGAILAGPAALLDGLYHERRMFGGGLPSAALPAALALDGLGEGGALEDCWRAVAVAMRELCARLDAIDGLRTEPFDHGSNIVRLRPAPEVDAARFLARLFEAGIVVPEVSSSWGASLLTCNPTLLRRPPEAVAAAFASAVAH